MQKLKFSLLRNLALLAWQSSWPAAAAHCVASRVQAPSRLPFAKI